MSIKSIQYTLAKKLGVNELTKNFYRNKEKINNWFGNEDNGFGLCPDSIYMEGKEIGREVYYRKIIPCGKESCQICGREGSLLHRQRFARGIRKILTTKYLGFFVITFPVEVRDVFASSSLLGRFSDYMRDLLKNMGFGRGVNRWHFGGDKHCGIWHPHLNILIDMKKKYYFTVGFIRILRRAIVKWIKEKTGIKVKDVVIEYHYCWDFKTKIKWWRYIVRPTLLLCGENIERLGLAKKLWNFRNIRWWGHWDKIKEGDCEGMLIEDKDIQWLYCGRISEWIYKETLLCWKYVGYGVFKLSYLYDTS